jgi:hypothetical protein
VTGDCLNDIGLLPKGNRIFSDIELKNDWLAGIKAAKTCGERTGEA